MINQQKAEKIGLIGSMVVAILWLNNERKNDNERNDRRINRLEGQVSFLNIKLRECYERQISWNIQTNTQEEQASSEFLVNSGNKPIDSGRKWSNTREATIETRNRNSRRGIIGGRG